MARRTKTEQLKIARAARKAAVVAASSFVPQHPGEILRKEILPRLSLSREQLAGHLGIRTRQLDDLLQERSPVTLDLAQRLGAAFGTGARYWLALQLHYDVWIAELEEPVRIAPIALRRPDGHMAATHSRQ